MKGGGHGGVVGRVDRVAEFGRVVTLGPALVLVLVRVVLDAMTRSLYSISPSPGPLSPSFSDDSSSLDGAPYIHDGAPPTASRPGSPTRRGQPANPAPAPDVVTCQWEDCGAAFDDLNTFIRHLHEGAARTLATPPPRPLLANPS